MVIKIDMENDFDRVKHNFLKVVLKQFGFNHIFHFLDWCMY
jgi:hypothetical protein